MCSQVPAYEQGGQWGGASCSQDHERDAGVLEETRESREGVEEEGREGGCGAATNGGRNERGTVCVCHSAASIVIAVVMIQAKRQQRKLNFLITQTELYAHFMARKSTGIIYISSKM